METSGILIACVSALVVGGVVYFFVKKNGTATKSDNSASGKDNSGQFDLSKAVSAMDLSNLKKEEVETIRMVDIIKWFQCQNLSKDKDIPFVLFNLPKELNKDGFTALMLGVLDSKSDEILCHNLISYKEMDDQTKDMMSHANNGLVVLGE